jgi:oligopeptide/dipeptide ABC transporter ATP-binding protein
MPGENIILEVQNLKKYFPVTRGIIFSKILGHIQAVDEVSLKVRKGETVGIVGESGCGKTTLGRVILQNIRPDGGSVLYAGRDITKVSDKELLPYRQKIQMVFQDPYSSLNPRKTIGAAIAEPLVAHGIEKNGRELKRQAMEILTTVGLADFHYDRYPHEFSGGQRQRIGFARSLILRPELLIADEPVSALDVSIQAQILNMMEFLQEKFGLTYIFITHDLGVVRHICNRVGVMYLGKFVEVAEVEELFENPLHPYTDALLSAVPVPDPEMSRKRILLEGDVPSPFNPPPGCRFYPRCALGIDLCQKDQPPLEEVSSGHLVACYRAKERN